MLIPQELQLSLSQGLYIKKCGIQFHASWFNKGDYIWLKIL